jgi:signal transduction histidine kinase
MSEKRQRTERSRTDSSLNSERRATDEKLEEWNAKARGEHDDSIQVARSRADRILAAARQQADSENEQETTTSARSEALRQKRRHEDALQRGERESEDARLAAERNAQDRVIAELLKTERGQTDLSLRVERERSDRLVNSQDEFFAMVSHDVRNLITTASVTLAYMIHDPALPEKLIAQADRVQRALGRMHHLVNDLTDVASIDAGRVRLDLRATDLAEVLQEVAESYRPVARQKEIAVTAHLSGPLTVLVDRNRLLQVISNLVNNAAKFTPAGGHIKISGERSNDQIMIAVEDDGPGIPADKQETVFEAFQQAHRTNRTGLGLGLFISKNVVAAHGGKIWVESTVGQGCTFHVALPAIPMDSLHDPRNPGAAHRASSSTGSEH